MTAGSDLCVSFAATTAAGLLREENEDAYCIEREGESPPRRYLAVVADGLGGHRAGEIASGQAVESLRRLFREWDGSGADRFVSSAIQHVNLEIYEAARATPEHFGMQTTITAATLAGNMLIAAHVGDCRLYRARAGAVETLTRDHTLAADMLRLRIISVEQAINHPARSQLTRSIGGDLIVRPDLVRDEMQPGDTYLLCSDGLWSQLTTNEIVEQLEESDLENGVQRLQEIAYERGAPDNVTAVLFRIRQVGPTLDSTSRWRALLRRSR